MSLLLSKHLAAPCMRFGLVTAVPARTAATKTIPPRRRTSVPNKHWNPLFRKERAAKVMKVELLDHEFDRRRARDEVTPEEMKEKLKKLGVEAPTQYNEKPMYISSTGAILDEYVPPEGDGKASIVSTAGAKQVGDKVKGKGKTMSSIRKIRSYDEDFDPREWVDEAMQVYIAAHRTLADGDHELLHKYATEKAYPEMLNMSKRKTIRWNFIKSLEPPRVLHARHAEIVAKENMFGQLTVRFNTQQTLAVYDRFGRLIHGSETVAKDVLEYVVFEKHLANVYGSWRLHAKIIPDWMPKREPGRLTYRVPSQAKAESNEKDEKKAVKDDEEEEGEKESIYDRFGRILGRK